MYISPYHCRETTSLFNCCQVLQIQFVFLKGLLHSREEGKNGSGDKQKKKRVTQFYKKDLKPELGHIYFLFLSLFFLQGPYSLWNLSFPTRN